MIATGISASKLDGAMPAIDGSAVTGVGDGVTKSASDPATDTNPSGGVGTVWLNTSSGEMFCCTDATTDENVWVNIGGGSGDIPAPYNGYVSGGEGGGQPKDGAVYKFEFANGSTNYSWGSLSGSTATGGQSSSSTHGYSMGGQPFNSAGTKVDKFSFASANDTTNLSDCSGRDLAGGAHSSTKGYLLGGRNPNVSSSIQSVTFSNDSVNNGIGSLAQSLYVIRAASNGSTHSYINGGRNSGNGKISTINTFAHANENNSSTHGSLDVGSIEGTMGTENPTTQEGFSCGGTTGTYQNVIEKYSFASANQSSDHGDLNIAVSSGASCRSLTQGMIPGGGGPTVNHADRMMFDFASNVTSTDIGDLEVARSWHLGHQVS